MKEDLLIAHRLIELCEKKGMSYYTLAFRSTVPITTIMNIIHGCTKNPGVYTLLKLCDGLGISIIEFFDDEIFDNIEADA